MTKNIKQNHNIEDEVPILPLEGLIRFARRFIAPCINENIPVNHIIQTANEGKGVPMLPSEGFERFARKFTAPSIDGC